MSNADQTFAEWYENKNNISSEARHTIEVIIKESGISTDNLEALNNVTKLYLSENKISDLRPLSALTNLSYLELWENEVSDLTPLSKLTNLNHLHLSYNKIRSITPLSNLTNLTELYLYKNKIRSITPLSNLTNLTELNLGRNKISSLMPLSNLTNLIYLGLWENEIRDLTPLSNLTNLTRLYLNRNKISLLTPLSSLINLIELGLCWNEIRDLKPLSKLINLTQLDLSDNPISSLTPLHKLTNLLSLDFSSTKVMDLSFVSALNELKITWNEVRLERKYWQPPEKWSAHWLLEEANAEVRRLLIQMIGYERICRELDTICLDNWREYSLLKIVMPPAENQEDMYTFMLEENLENEKQDPDIYLLKMICPSTGYIHMIRVPPEMTSCREAVQWINWGIDAEEFAIEA